MATKKKETKKVTKKTTKKTTKKNQVQKTSKKEVAKKGRKTTVSGELKKYLKDKDFQLAVFGEMSHLVKMRKSVTKTVTFDLSKLCDENNVSYSKKPLAKIEITQVSGQANAAVKVDIAELPELSQETHYVLEVKTVDGFKKDQTKLFKKLREVIRDSLRALKNHQVNEEVKLTNETLAAENFTSAIARKEEVSNTVYHSCEGLSSSDIKMLYKKSKAHWEHYRKNKEADSTKSKDYGGAAHCLALEPENFEKNYYVKPDLDARSHKTHFEILEMNNFAKTPIKESDLDEIKRKIEMLKSDENFKKVLETSETEISLFLKEGDLVKKARLDLLTPVTQENIEAVQNVVGAKHEVEIGEALVFDLKFLKDIAPNEFSRDCGNYRFDISDVYYTDVLKKVLKDQGMDSLTVVDGVTFITIEKGDVDLIESRYIDEEDLDQSKLCISEAIMKYRDSFKGYSSEPVKIKMPKYIKVQNHEL